jgi:hypothetical protein
LRDISDQGLAANGWYRAGWATERAAVQSADMVAHRMGPVIGAANRSRKRISAISTTSRTSPLLVLQQLGLLEGDLVGEPHYRGNELPLQSAQ